MILFETTSKNIDYPYIIQLEEINKLQQSEKVCNNSVDRLSKNILEEGKWTTVIPVEASTGWVMDGNHRLNAARSLRLKYVPVVKLHYEDLRVSIFWWGTDRPYPLDKIRYEASHVALLSFKTTRHIFSPLLPKVNILLSTLTG